MPRHVAFLRAINVGGHNVKMEDLQTIFESIGFAGVETFIASGNVIFETTSKSSPAIERKIEKALGTNLGFEVATFVRTIAEVSAIAHYEPFSKAALKTAEALNVAFLAATLNSEQHKKLATLETTIDDFHVHGREVYWLCLKRQSESKFSNVVFERTLGVCATFRGMNTVRRLAAKYFAG